jgi:hypothetical protein
MERKSKIDWFLLALIAKPQLAEIEEGIGDI